MSFSCAWIAAWSMPGLKIWTLAPNAGAVGDAWTAASVTGLVDHASAKVPATIKVRTVRILISTPPPNLNCCLQPGVPRRASRMERVRARVRHPGARRLTEVLEQTRGHDQARRRLRTWLRVDGGKGRQHLGRPGWIAIGPLEIELHHLTPRAPARVADGHNATEVLGGADRPPVGDDRFVGPVRVSEAVAEGELGLGASPVVAAVANQQALRVNEIAAIRMGMQDRRVDLIARHGDRKAPAGLDDPQQGVRECVAEGLAGKPHLHHRRDLI